MAAVGPDHSRITPYYFDDSAPVRDPAVPDRGDSYIPDNGTPTAALPTVNARGYATGGGRWRAMWTRFRDRMGLLFRSGRG